MRFPKEETARIRAAVFSRAAGSCEACGGWVTEATGELDHWQGRRVAQSVRNTWALCRACHTDRTANRPSASEWCRRFIAHALKHEFHEEARLADVRLFSLYAKGIAT